MNLIFTLYAYYKTTKIFDVIFLIPIVSYLLILLATLLGVKMSYLEDRIDVSYYQYVIVLDLIAYVSIFFAIKIINVQDVLLSTRRMFNRKIVFYFGCVLISINLIIVLPYLGQPYSVITSKHTPIFELGWILVSMFIVMNSRETYVKYYIIIISILLVFSLPFGARMQPSFGVLSIIIYLSHFLSKTRVLLIFLILTTASLIIGILRDLVSLDGSAVAIMTGFNQGAILRTSSVILQYKDSLTALQSMMNTLGTFFVFPVSGTVFTGQGVYLNLELEKFKQIQGNGGNLGTLLYFYFGILYPVIIFIVTFVLSRIGAFRFLLILAVVTPFRWQQYNFIPLLKLYPFIFVLGVMIHLLPNRRSNK